MDKMETTENLGLKKPSQDDYYNVDDFNYNADAIDEFCGRTDNPHNVTKEQVGLGNVPNVSTNDQIPTFTEAETLTALKSGEKLSVSLGKIAKAIKDSISHFATKATASVFGHVKLTDSSAVTDGTGLALPATEKNASIDGTLANQISNLSTSLSTWGCVFDAEIYNNTVLEYVRVIYNDATHIAILTYSAIVNADITADDWFGLFGLNFKTSQIIYSTCFVRGGSNTSPSIRLDNNVVSINSSDTGVKGKVIGGEIVFHYVNRW